MRRALLLLAGLGLAVHAAFAQSTYQPAAGRTLLRAGHVLDVHTGKEAADETIVIAGDKIVAIAATSATPAVHGDRVVDLTAYTVMPGLIDVHTHLTMANNFDPYFELTMTPGKEAILGVENAKTTLEAGFTTVRNVGANGFTDVALRDEINAGHIPGPHMQVSGPALGITGGHMDENLLPEQYHVQGEGVADGIPAVQHMVRTNIKYGADLIKLGRRAGCCRRAMIRRRRSTRSRRCRRSLRTRIGWAGRWRRTRMERRRFYGRQKLAWIRLSTAATWTMPTSR